MNKSGHRAAKREALLLHREIGRYGWVLGGPPHRGRSARPRLGGKSDYGHPILPGTIEVSVGPKGEALWTHRPWKSKDGRVRKFKPVHGVGYGAFREYMASRTGDLPDNPPPGLNPSHYPLWRQLVNESVHMSYRAAVANLMNKLAKLGLEYN
jgi:hypothetical protein